MDDKKKIEELQSRLARRERWFERLRNECDELQTHACALQEELDNVKAERDALLGDTVKLKALVAELEAKLAPAPKIILP